MTASQNYFTTELSKPGKETVLFQPGQIGVKADWGTGLVRAVPEGGQGAKLGVEPGWQLTEIDGEP
ncbi:unnamed protein product, partial [Prorocentrum cordatum]